MTINVFDLAEYSPNLLEHETLNICCSINSIFFEDPDKDWNNPIFHSKPKTPKYWVEYYQRSAINCELLTIDDPVFKDGWKDYHLGADKWKCCCKEDDKTGWCYYEDIKSSAKCSQW